MTQISVDGVLHSKAPGLARWIPRPLVRWIERTIHEDEINHVLATYDTGDPFDFLHGYFGYLGVSYEAVGLDDLGSGDGSVGDGRYVFASNHPFGGMDGMMLADVIGTRFGDVRVVVNDLLMFLDPLKGIFVPVNKHGAQRGANATAFNEAFSGPLPVLTFPAGLCSRRTKDGASGVDGAGLAGDGISGVRTSGAGAICDLEWRPNFVKRAEQTGRMIVPVFVEGGLSKRFYRVSEWRKRLGIKANIEMLFLPDEMFRQKGRHFRLIFGAPVSVDELRALVNSGAGEGMGACIGAKKAAGNVYSAMAQEVKRRSYELAKKK